LGNFQILYVLYEVIRETKKIKEVGKNERVMMVTINEETIKRRMQIFWTTCGVSI